MGLTYEVITEEGKTRVSLSCNGSHICSVWGEIDTENRSDFDRKNGIITVIRDSKCIGMFWNTEPLQEDNKQLEKIGKEV